MRIEPVFSNGRFAKWPGRLVWIGMALPVVWLTIAGLPFRTMQLVGQNQWFQTELGLQTPPELAARIVLFLELLIGLVFFISGAFLAWCKSTDRLGIIAAFAFLASAATFPGMTDAVIDETMTTRWLDAAWFIYSLRALSSTLSILLFYLLPDGRLVPNWTKILTPIWILLNIGWLLFPQMPFSVVYGDTFRATETASIFVATAWWLTGIAAQIYRFRHVADTEARQQIKWMAFGLGLAGLGYLGYLFIRPLHTVLGFSSDLYVIGRTVFSSIFLICLPICFTITIFRYHLWGIDLLINRTLVYSTLTAGTMGIYVMMVGGFGVLLPAQQGQTAAFILATGLVLVTIRPLHTQLQTAANRLIPLPAAPLLTRDSAQETELTINRSPLTINHFLLRLVWLTLTAVSLLWFAANVPAFYRQVAAVSDTPGWYAAVTAGLDVIFVGLCTAVALLIFRRQPNNRMAWLTSLVLIVWGAYNGLLIQTKGAILGDLNDNPGLIYYATELVTLAGYMGWMLFFYLFPAGRFVPRWTKITAVGWVLFSGSWYLWPTSPYTPNQWPGWLFGPAVLALWGSFLVAQVVRYRRFSTPVERQQTKWVLYGIAIAVLIAPPVWVLVGTVFEISLADWPRHLFVQTVGIVGIAAIPLTIGIAILRHRLFDIDVLINRTLVYGGLTAVTIGIYVLLVGGVGSLLQAQGSAVVAFVATGFVAVLFQPLRVGLQTAVNRLMYGQRDDPVGMLTHLAQRLEAVDSPDRILPTLVETIATALKLPHVSLWLPKDEKQWAPAAVFGPQSDDLLMVPLLHQNQEVGRLFVAPRGPGERFSREDERLLAAIGQLSATTVQAAQLTFELQQSRRQIVTSREEERRRLRRDLHDGLGPVLASVALQADTARDLADSDPAQTKAILDSIMNQAQTAVADVRQLVYGLRPPALDELGLTGALRQSAQAMQGKVAVTIAAPEPLPPLPAAVEVAAYRIAQEAVNNVVKHAQARTCTITIRTDDRLRLVIEDDGMGVVETAVSGVGLISMKERAAELGGSFTIQHLPEGGTRVMAVLPLPSDE